MKLRISCVLHAPFEIELDPHKHTTISSIKELIQQKKKFDTSLQKLVYKGRVLKDERTLESYNIHDGSYIVLLMKIKGRRYAFKEEIQQDLIERQREVIQKEKERMKDFEEKRRRNMHLSLIENGETPTSISIEDIPFNPADVAFLVSLGFSEATAKKALLLNFMNISKAAEWLLQHANSPQLDEPLTSDQILDVLIRIRELVSSGMTSPRVNV